MTNSERREKVNERLSKDKAGALDGWLRFKDARPASGWIAVLFAAGIPGRAVIYHVVNRELRDYPNDQLYFPRPLDIWTPVPKPPTTYLTWRKIQDGIEGDEGDDRD